ncbi:MAG: LysR family transcriptional regulator, partial [Mycobacterium sp.]
MPDRIYQPTIAGLRAFAAIAEKRQFSAAATTLGVSQSTLSQALAALETGLGTQLIERSTRRVLLTAEGTELLPRAQAVIEAVDAFTAAAAGSSDPLRAGMRLGLIPTVAPYVLPTVLAGLAEQFPGVTLRVTEDQTERLMTVLREGALDAALIALPADIGGVTAIPIYDEDFVL